MPSIRDEETEIATCSGRPFLFSRVIRKGKYLMVGRTIIGDGKRRIETLRYFGRIDEDHAYRYDWAINFLMEQLKQWYLDNRTTICSFGLRNREMQTLTRRNVGDSTEAKNTGGG